jgi:hypothetical protein
LTRRRRLTIGIVAAWLQASTTPRRHSRASSSATQGKPPGFWSSFHIKMVLVILPRQARDNHRESTQRRSACLQLAVLHARGGRAPRCQHSQLFLRLRTRAVPGLHVLLEQIVGGLPLRYDTRTSLFRSTVSRCFTSCVSPEPVLARNRFDLSRLTLLNTCSCGMQGS